MFFFLSHAHVKHNVSVNALVLYNMAISQSWYVAVAFAKVSSPAEMHEIHRNYL